jgi:hypothetical protein
MAKIAARTALMAAVIQPQASAWYPSVATSRPDLNKPTAWLPTVIKLRVNAAGNYVGNSGKNWHFNI